VIVLGIDAAWTATQPSGVAVLRARRGGWQCVALAPSYASFLALAAGTRVDWRVRPQPALARCDELLAATVRLAGGRPDVIAIDMPLATAPITARRAADNAIASAYGRRGLGAHSPSETRPGQIADAMRAGFAAHGYTLATTATRAGTRGMMIEVFPHAAAIALLGADYRVPYKLARVTQYWPSLAPAERRRAVLAQWRKLRRALAAEVDGVALRVPTTGPLAALKRFEDALDAALCAWIGAEYLAKRLRPYGDPTAAVWAHPP
jgi:predicted RNase H-like nuclease